MSTKLEDDVRVAFDRAIEGAIAPEELMTAVRVLVRNLKREGRPPETVIVAIKDLCGLSRLSVPSDTDSSVDSSESRKISDMVVRAAIDEYYTGSRLIETGSRLIGRRPWKGYSSELEDLEETKADRIAQADSRNERTAR
jgi:hypothetical protein